MSHSAPFAAASLALTYALGGHGEVTLVSKRTGRRFTYQVREIKNNPGSFFVSVLAGADNTADYTYIGNIWEGKRFWNKAKTPAAAAFEWGFAKLLKGELPDTLEIWHDGTCGRCGRKLTTPESVAKGIGPVCDEKE